MFRAKLYSKIPTITVAFAVGSFTLYPLLLFAIFPCFTALRSLTSVFTFDMYFNTSSEWPEFIYLIPVADEKSE